LVEEFKTNEHIYKTVAFDEENTKINFINKFFQALGWDVTNEAGVAPQFKDVEFEDTVIVGGKPKAPDYCFRIGGARIFFVEAKKPSVDIEHDRRYAFQLKRYTWSAHLPLGLLTDFEELAIYEPKTAPKKTHNTSVDRIKYYHYSEYVDNWEEIYNIYSKEAVLTGKFDQYVKNIHGDKKGTSTVDSEFLKTIEEWRLELAKNIALRNKELTVDELNFAVQLIIDRIIFLRIAEDRGIERYGQLKKLTELARNEKDNYPVYDAFIELCRKADAKYNSGLFHFTEEKDISLSADTLTPGLHVDDGKLKKIIDGLYYPDCPYEFSMISTEILGNIYEQFLGKVIRLTEGHQAKVEDKPLVKKAGGVYYTPQYIVKYIVDKSVGELLKGKTPNQVSELRIVDPACGSGSFLLGAYQKLLDWHVDYYSNLDQPPKNVIYTGKDGMPRLTIQEKKRILLNNIYGVDIDSQAVEVTKLSLLLKVLEDENKDVLEAQQKLIQERALPYLGDNILCGNSIIESDILLNENLSSEEIADINPFNWSIGFKDIMNNGGFDAVIGNPPYVSVETMDETSKKYYQKSYKTFVKRADLYCVFIENSLNELSKKYVSFIIPSTIFSNISYKKLRNLILDNKYLDEVCYTGYNVFKATVDTTILVMNKKSKKKIKLINAIDFDNKSSFSVPRNYFQSFDNVISIDDENTVKIMNKLFNDEFISVKDNFTIFQGIVTGYNPAFIFDSIQDALNNNVNQELLKPICFGKDINQWDIENRNNVILYVDDEKSLKNFPNTKMWLKQNREHLNKYSLHRPRKKHELDVKNKILVQRTRNERLKKRIVATIDETGIYTAESLWNIIPKNEECSIYFLLGILNSNLINYLFSTKFLNLGIKKDYLNKISFPNIGIEDQKPIINLVEKLLGLHEELKLNKVPNLKSSIETQIITFESKLNELVYELYDLTDEEIAIVENEVGNDS
ncbi:MAG: N-6 DNA methylase, partial [Clostridia bacterium]|nr:N-6 DNA methylase [Clostridia bacterium]